MKLTSSRKPINGFLELDRYITSMFNESLGFAAFMLLANQDTLKPTKEDMETIFNGICEEFDKNVELHISLGAFGERPEQKKMLDNELKWNSYEDDPDYSVSQQEYEERIAIVREIAKHRKEAAKIVLFIKE